MVHVAGWMAKNGRVVIVGPMTFAKTHADWKQHSDSGDLFEITHEQLKSLEKKRIEVKTLGYEFSCRRNWPHREFAVCERRSWDDAPEDEKPEAYVLLAKSMKYAGIVLPEKTRSRWYHGSLPNRNYQGEDRRSLVYMCKLDDVIFHKLRDPIDKMAEERAGKVWTDDYIQQELFPDG